MKHVLGQETDMFYARTIFWVSDKTVCGTRKKSLRCYGGANFARMRTGISCGFYFFEK